MDKPAVVPVENNTSAPIVLPATRSFPHGLVFLPTEMRSVEQKYIDELCERKVKSQDGDGNALPDRYPGKEEWLRLTTQRVKYVVVRENQIRDEIGTLLTVYTPEQAPRADGIMLPVSLVTYNAVAAKAIINSTSDLERLELWSKEKHKDKDVPMLAKTRLNALKG